MIAIIAEKPSVGMDIARVVGADTRNDGYCSGNGYMVTWALGHLVSLAIPDTYGYTKTAEEDLPMLPDPFRLVSRQMRTDRGMVTDIAASKQLKVIESVFNRCDSIVVATDAGREGELIFRWIYDFLGCTKPFRRLWISSLTDEAIRKGLEELKDGSEYDSLYTAADSRAKADWLVGVNASRALAIVSGSSNNSIGRVQTPTLAMICSRYRENRSFVSHTGSCMSPSMAARHTAASSIPRPLTTGRRRKPPTAVSLPILRRRSRRWSAGKACNSRRCSTT